MLRMFKSKLLVALVAFSACGIAPAADVIGAGSSFVYPVMAKWSADYRAVAQTKINYQAIGSGGGIAQIRPGQSTSARQTSRLIPPNWPPPTWCSFRW